MLSSPHSGSCPTSSTPCPSPRFVTNDLHHTAMETLWREVRSIEEEEEEEEEKGQEEEMNSVDEVEVEEAWLTEAGLSSLVASSPSGEGPAVAEALLSTLTHQQVVTVKKRLDNYNETLKKRHRQPIRDVRDIFMEVPDDEPANRCPSPPSHHADSTLRRYHSTTKTIRRNATRVRTTFPSSCFENQLPEHPSSPTPPPTDTTSPENSLTTSYSVSVSPLTPADWLLRDSTYSEAIGEHKRGGTCWDCLQLRDGDVLFQPPSPGQGLVLVEDLSSVDLTRLGYIAHIELSTFLHVLGVQIKRSHRPRRRIRDRGVFGLPLTTLLENDRKKHPGVKVPVVFQKLLCVLEETGLQTEGILRVPGSAVRLKYLRRLLDRNSQGFDWSEVKQVDAAGLLKLFIRELPTPLLTCTHMCTYSTMLGVTSVIHQVQALQLLTLLLPEANRNMLQALLAFLRKLVSYQDQNRMSIWNVSMVMAPNLFTCRHHSNKHSTTRQQEEMEEAVATAHMVHLMIKHQDLLWTVPAFLLNQVRHMNQAANQKEAGISTTKRLRLRRKNVKNDKNQLTQLSDGVIRVHAPLHTKVSTAIQLDGQTRAKDIIARFECNNSGPAQNLYEVGGNICERRLHPDCILLDVYHVNPQCDWLIKP